MDLLLTERLLLLTLDDASGRNTAGPATDTALAGAILLDLVAAGTVGEADGALIVVPGRAPAHLILRDALQVMSGSSEPRDASDWVRRLPRGLKPMRERVARGLVDRGVLDEERRRVFGVLPSQRFPEVDGEPEARLRADLHAILVDGRPPQADEAALVGLVGSLGLVRGLVPKDRRRQAERRAAEVGDVGAAAAAVDGAVRAAVLAATMAGVAAAIGGATSAAL